MVLFEMTFGGYVGKKFLNGGERGASVSERDDAHRIQVVTSRPAGPDARDGGSGIDKDAIHVNQKGSTKNAGHRGKL
jgi:hypothetical protein